MKSRVAAAVSTLAVLLAGCGDGSNAEDTSAQGTPAAAAPAVTAVADALDDIAAVSKVAPLTKDVDVEGLLGAPDGYTEGAVVYDSRLKCQQPGIECGALVEAWADPKAAEVRSEEILTLQLGMPELGIEHHFLRDGVLVRVWGDLTKKQAREYDEALQSA